MSQWIGKNKNRVWFAALFNALFFLALFALLRPSFETNDDISISMIANGSWGKLEAHVICQNYLLGLLYTLLYGITGSGIPWYALVQILAVFASLTTVTWVLLRRMKPAQGLLLSGILMIYYGYEGYFRMQYTKTAGMAAAAGLFLLFEYVMERQDMSACFPTGEELEESGGKAEKRLGIGALLWGVLLAVIGSLYRFEEAAACAAVISGIGVWLLLLLPGCTGKEKWRRIGRYFAVFFTTLALMCGGELFDRWIYASDPEWDAYMQYNELRSELTDYSSPSWKEFKEEYQEMGINKTAYKIFMNGRNFYDPDVYSLETLQKMADLRPRNQLSRALVEQFFEEYPVGFLKIAVFPCFLLLAMLWLFWKQKGWRSWLIAAYEIVVMGGIDFLLFYQGRYLENRVEVGLWFAISLTVLWLYDRERIRVSGQGVLLTLLGLVMISQSTWKDKWRVLTVQKEVTDRAYLRQCYSEVLETDPEGLYLSKLGRISYTSYAILDAVPEGAFSQVVWLGGWEMCNPDWQEKLAEYGITNPYRDLIDQEHVYLVDDDIDLTLSYIKSYYQENVEAVEVKDAGYMKVYQIRSTSAGEES